MKKKRPIKSLSLETQAFIRRRVIELHRQNESPANIASIMNLGLRTVYRWISDYAVGGADALALRKHPGPGSQIDGKQLSELARIIIDTDPSQYCFEFKLWTLRRVKDVISREFNLHFSIQWIAVLLKRLGLSPQKPKLASRKQDVVWVERWRKEELPALQARAVAEGSEIWYADEASFRASESIARTWGRVGKTPEIRVGVSHGGINIISAMSSNGELEFMATESTVGGHIFTVFLSRLIAGREKKIILVVDNSSVHTCKLTQAFADENKEKLELVFLPPYSPDLNPAELVWAQAKKVTRSMTFQSLGAFKERVLQTMRELSAMTGLTKRFYDHCTSFAAVP